jgi:hypothetical protein
LNYRLRKIAAAGLFAALALAITYPLAGIPNIKFFEICLFISGAFLGLWGGLVVPIVAGTIYIIFNPNGPQTIVLVGVAQMAGFILFGLGGALLGKMILANKNRIVGVTFCAATGVVITFIYDLLTNAALGVSIGVFLPTLYGGIGFSLIHMASNGLIFGISEPLVVKLWQVAGRYLYSR